ncbi:MAG: hypothetical protein JWR21_1761 [Herminiimonas sp.]|nr:hypothetical protein [Herminiimonas sp.]MDB5853359.1 hypothetical protein [Herminiimonas sp.]
MTLTGILFLLLFVVIGIVLLRFALKIASVLIVLGLLVAVGCWLSPAFYESVKPYIDKVTPLVMEGSKEAASTAKALRDQVEK